VSFSTDAGTVLGVTTSGSVSAVISSANVGSTPVTVTSGFATTEATVPIGCGSGAFGAGPVSINVSCTSTQALITAFVSDSFGNPALDGTPIAFAATPGSIIQPGFTVGGIATAAWTPTPGVTGSAVITVTVNNSLSQSFTVNCGPNGGAAARVNLFIPQSSVTCGSQAYIFASATDIFGNPAGGDSLITFSTNTGSVIPAAKFSFGSALSEFTATPGQPAFAQIVANSGGVLSQISLPVTCG
jgi:hypothetical protein